MQEAKVTEHKAHILVVDDVVSVRQALREGLTQEGYTVTEASDKSTLMARIEQEPPVQLITLDLMLGQEDGLQLAREIRARRNIPIVMITARTEPNDRVVGLEHGADDYITKPFHIREALLRIRSVLRRYRLEQDIQTKSSDEKDSDERYACSIGSIDVKRRELRSTSGVAMDLTDAEFDILVSFVRNPARVLSRDDLTLLLKGRQWSPTDRTLDGHIARLRKKIEPDLSQPRFIKTVWRVGYVLADEVRRIRD